MKLKRLSLFLALVMILSAFAGTFTFASAEDGAWKVGDAYYTNVSSAVAAATNGETVYLTKNYSTTGGAEAIKPVADVVIDLQGYSVTKADGSTGRWINVDSSVAAGTEVTVKNGKITSYYQGSIAQINAASVVLTFENVTLISDGCVANTNAAIIVNGANSVLNLNNVEMIVKGSMKYIIWNNVAGGVVNVNGLKFLGYTSVTNYFIYLANATGKATFMGDIEMTRHTASHCAVFVDKGGEVIIGDVTGKVATTIKSVNQTRFAATQNPASGAAQTTGKVVYAAYNATIEAHAGDSLFQHTTATADSSVTIENCVISIYGGKIIRGDANVAGATYTIKDSILATTTTAILSTNATVNMTNTSVVNNVSGQLIIDSATDDIKAEKSLYITGTIAGAPVLDSTNAASIDAYAKFVGYNFRVSDPVTAYADGAFTGYKFTWENALTSVAAGGTITAIDDALFYSNTVPSVAFTADLNGKTLSTLGAPVRLMNNINTAITVKNGNIVCSAGGSSLVQFASNADSGAKLTISDVNFYAKVNKSTTSMFQMLGANGSIKFTGKVTFDADADAAVHALVQPYGQNQTVTFENADVTTKRYSRVIGMNATSHNTAVSSTIAAVAVNITGSTIKTDAWGGFFENYATLATVTLKDTAIEMPTDNKLLRLNVGTSVVVNGGEAFVAGEETTYYMPSSKMLTGASVRIARGNKLAESGIRFESTLSAAIIAEVNGLLASGAIANATVGTVVFKYEDLGTKTVAELVEAANADANDDLIVADIEAVNGVVMNEDGSANIRAAIINIKEKNYGVKFGAVAYIEYELADGETVRLYGTFNKTNNVRSIEEVATSALKDTKTAAEIEANGSANFGGYVYANEVAEGVYSCYSDEQIAILNTYVGK